MATRKEKREAQKKKRREERKKAKREQQRQVMPSDFFQEKIDELFQASPLGRPKRASDVPYKKICWEVREDLLQALREEADQKGMTLTKCLERILEGHFESAPKSEPIH